MSWLQWESVVLGGAAMVILSAVLVSGAFLLARAREGGASEEPSVLPDPSAEDDEPYAGFDRVEPACRELVGFDPRLN